jgi:hypothetical protein
MVTMRVEGYSLTLIHPPSDLNIAVKVNFDILS